VEERKLATQIFEIFNFFGMLGGLFFIITQIYALISKTFFMKDETLVTKNGYELTNNQV
jgi:hypothetical protein